MRAAVIPLMIAVSLTGCFASKPHDNVGFVTAHSLQELAGTYNNRGESKEPGYFLSHSIWPLDKTLPHDSITAISVQAIGDTALTVRALQGSDVVKEGVYLSGKDFTFSNGRLHLRTRTENTLHDPEAGGLFIARISQELGVDQRGQGKSKEQVTIVGAAYLVVPIAMGISTEVRYARIVGP